MTHTPALERAAHEQGAAPYASLYAALAANLKQAAPPGGAGVPAREALALLPHLSFATDEFTGFVRRLTLAGNAWGALDEQDRGQTRLAFAKLPFTVKRVRRADQPGSYRFSSPSNPYSLSPNPSDDLLPDDEEAIYLLLAARAPITRAQFYALSARARQHALTVAGLTEDAIREIVRPALLAAEAGDLDYRGFLDALGGLQLGVPGRLSPELHAEIVYRTNVVSAYNHGALDYGLVYGEGGQPGAELLVVMDERTSGICRPLYRKVVSREMVLNGLWCPPFHYSCRTGIGWIYPEEWRELDPERKLAADYWAAADDQARILAGFGGYTPPPAA